jgi:hypothetical protein
MVFSYSTRLSRRSTTRSCAAFGLPVVPSERASSDRRLRFVFGGIRPALVCDGPDDTRGRVRLGAPGAPVTPDSARPVRRNGVTWPGERIDFQF